MTTFSAEFEPESLAIISRMAGWQTYFAPTLQHANEDSAQVIIDTIPTVTDWKSGDGILDHSFFRMSSTPYQVIFGSDLPYAHRQSEGFTGPDSLGRMINTPATHFVEKAIDAASNQVEDIYMSYTEQAFNAL